MYKKAVSIIIALMLMTSSVSAGAAGFYYSNSQSHSSSESSSYSVSFSQSSSSVTEYSEEHFESYESNNSDNLDASDETQNNNTNEDVIVQEIIEAPTDNVDILEENQIVEEPVFENPTEKVVETQAEVPAQNILNVTATSNMFSTQTQSVNTDLTDTVTVSYFISSDLDMLNNEWELTYDPNVLSFDKADNVNASNRINLMPQVGSSGAVYNFNTPGLIKANASSLSLYEISERSTFVTATFKIIGSGDTNVNLNVKTLSFAEFDYETDMMKEDSNVSVVQVSQLCESYNSIVKDVDTVIYGGSYDPFATNPSQDVDPTEVTQPVTEVEPTTEETQPVTEVEPTTEETQPVTEVEPTTEETQPVTEVEPATEETQPETEVEPTTEETQPATEAEPTTEENQPTTDGKKPSTKDEIDKNGYYVYSTSNMFSDEVKIIDKSSKTFSVVYYLKSKTPVLNSQFEFKYDSDELTLVSAEMPVFKEGSVINTSVDGVVYANASSLSLYDFSDKSEFAVFVFERNETGKAGSTTLDFFVNTLTFAESGKNDIVDVDTINTVYKNGSKINDSVRYSTDVEIIVDEEPTKSDATPDEPTKPISSPDEPSTDSTSSTSSTSSTTTTTTIDATSSVSTKDTPQKSTTSTSTSTTTTTTTTTNTVKTGSPSWAMILLAILSASTGAIILANRKRYEK